MSQQNCWACVRAACVCVVNWLWYIPQWKATMHWSIINQKASITWYHSCYITRTRVHSHALYPPAQKPRHVGCNDAARHLWTVCVCGNKPCRHDSPSALGSPSRRELRDHCGSRDPQSCPAALGEPPCPAACLCKLRYLRRRLLSRCPSGG